MSYPIRLRDEAERDIALAASWYEEQREGLGQEFLDELLATLGTIAEQPRAYPALHRDVRRALMRRFPFGVFFQTTASDIVVVAVFHGSRHLRGWRRRA
jgi:plasmid stabilization system protein ParE